MVHKFVIKYADGTHRIDCCSISEATDYDWSAAWKKLWQYLERDKRIADVKSVMAIRNPIINPEPQNGMKTMLKVLVHHGDNITSEDIAAIVKRILQKNGLQVNIEAIATIRETTKERET